MKRLRINTLGGIRVELGGETINFSRYKALALLVFLAVSGERSSREFLATMFWPENTQTRALANLRQAIWDIQCSLGENGLEVSRESLQLTPGDNISIDVSEIHDLLEKVKKHGHPSGNVCEQCLDNLKQASLLFNGDFLAGFNLKDSPEFDNWQYFQKEELNREISGVYNQLVDWYSEKQDFDQAIYFARRWLQLDELNENAHRALMRLYSAKGQRNAAIRQYLSCVGLLEQQLKISPEGITTELYEMIRSGTLELKTEPKESQPLTRSKLPAQVTPFVGRIDEVARLSQLLLGADTRLLTILAPGGMGKSRLAIEIARKLMSHFSDGILFVPLAPLETSEMFISYFANAIGYLRVGGQPLNQQLMDYFQEKSMLLVLDNLEHLTTMSDWIRDLLAISPNLKILATSRIPLNIKAEARFHLKGLNFPEEGTTEDFSTFSAVKLFLRSSQRVKPLFIPAMDDWQYIGEICRLVEGMPLAIEMAASWMEMLSLSEIVKEIRRGLAFFETDFCDIPARQRSLYAVFDYSWKKIDKKEREQFSQLTIFRGGFTREAAERIVGISLRQLVKFVNRSILNRTPEDRFEIHELLRQYGFEKLQANLVSYQNLITRYAEYYSRKMGGWQEDLKTGKLRQAMIKISDDFENIRHAWEVALHFERLDLIETSLGGLILYFDYSFRDDEGLALFEMAAKNISDETRQGVRILSLLTGYLVWLNLSLGNYEQGEKKFRESLTLMHRVEPIQTREEKYAQAFHLFLKGIYNRFHGDLSVFKKLFLQSINLFEELGENWWCELIYRFLGNAAWTGKMASDTIDVYYQKALKIARTLNDHYGMARTLEMLGVFCAYSKGDLEKAESYFRESSRIFLELDDGYSYIRYNICLEQIANINGRFQEVLELRQKRLHFLEKSGDPASISVVYMELGETYHHIGDYASAEKNGWKAVMGKGGLKDFEVRSRWFLGLTLIAKKDYQQANHLLSEAMKITCELTEEPELAGSLAALTRIEIANGNDQVAERLLIEGLEEAITAGFPFNMLYILASAALFLAVRGNTEKALEVYSLINSWQFVSNSVWFSDVYKKPLLSLIDTEDIIVKERQPKDTLWKMAELLLAELKQA
ncbi:MAG: BTAD domain-containing putative transcriptional regulator [Brevefilum sp.]|nr:BTAD domain-containing putative transcriptional regulator [Brevefilum sp.]